MVFIQSLILVGLSLSFFLGQLWRLNFGSFSFPAIDVFIILLAVTNLFTRPTLKNKFFLWFLIYAWLNLFINSLIHHYPIFMALPYLIRLSAILLLLIFPPKINPQIKKYFILAILANIIFGLIQYFIWPDLTYFKAIGWDDHLNRLVSTFLDPTFTGLIYLLFLIYLFFQKNHHLVTSFLFPVTFLALVLTYSRSTFLALIICSIFISLKLRNFRIFALGFCLIILAVSLLPRPPGEGTHLERTSSIFAKSVNLQEGLKLFTTSPLVGYGYNNLPLIRLQTKTNLHSLSGFDSSLLTILTTTGLIGLALFILGFYKMFFYSSPKIQTMLVAIFVHSLFANSLLYPFTLIVLILI